MPADPFVHARLRDMYTYKTMRCVHIKACVVSAWNGTTQDSGFFDTCNMEIPNSSVVVLDS